MKVLRYQRLIYENGESSLASPLGVAMWLHAYVSKTDAQLNFELVKAYLSGKTLTDCLARIQNDDNEDEIEGIVDWFVGILRQTPLLKLKDALKNEVYSLAESIENVPQLSSFQASTLGIIDLLAAADRPLTYSDIGYHLYSSDPRRNDVAKKKYGENASKFASILGLVDIGRDGNSSAMCVQLTRVGKAVQRASGDRMEIVVRLFYKLALFRDLVCSDFDQCADKFRFVVGQLQDTTQHRRSSAFEEMVCHFRRYGGEVGEKTGELICHMRH